MVTGDGMPGGGGEGGPTGSREETSRLRGMWVGGRVCGEGLVFLTQRRLHALGGRWNQGPSCGPMAMALFGDVTLHRLLRWAFPWQTRNPGVGQCGAVPAR